jgi:hypothetical protein
MNLRTAGGRTLAPAGDDRQERRVQTTDIRAEPHRVDVLRRPRARSAAASMPISTQSVADMIVVPRTW